MFGYNYFDVLLAEVGNVQKVHSENSRRNQITHKDKYNKL